MTRIATEIVAALLALGGLLLLLDANGLQAHRSLLGIGLILLAVLMRLTLIIEQQRQQTVLLALIAEGQDAD